MGPSGLSEYTFMANPGILVSRPVLFVGLSEADAALTKHLKRSYPAGLKSSLAKMGMWKVTSYCHLLSHYQFTIEERYRATVRSGINVSISFSLKLLSDIYIAEDLVGATKLRCYSSMQANSCFAQLDQATLQGLMMQVKYPDERGRRDKTPTPLGRKVCWEGNFLCHSVLSQPHWPCYRMAIARDNILLINDY